MPPEPHTSDAVRQLTLPSGRTIEIVYLDGQAATEAEVNPRVPARDQEAALNDAAADLTLCGTCGCSFVQPVDWEEAGARHWRLQLRCPNCEARGTVVVEDDVIDRYDLLLERGSAELARELHRIVEDNIEDEVTRLHDALESGLLLPEDF